MGNACLFNSLFWLRAPSSTFVSSARDYTERFFILGLLNHVPNVLKPSFGKGRTTATKIPHTLEVRRNIGIFVLGRYMAVILNADTVIRARRIPREVGRSDLYGLLFAVGIDALERTLLLKKITLANYRQDRHYPRIVKATEDLLREKGFVAPVDLFIRMDLLSPESVEGWRRGRIPYLERLIRCNLSKASRILRILQMHAHDLDLKSVPTVYKRWTKGPRTLLRFSKKHDRHVEDAYARHFFFPSKETHLGELGRHQHAKVANA